jgi:hypothetical protein
MKLLIVFSAIILVLGLREGKAEELIEVTPSETEVIASELKKEAQSPEHTKRTREYLHKISTLFAKTKSTISLEVQSLRQDCTHCSGEKKTEIFVTKLGRSLGRGAAWLSTTTAKPFMAAAAFVRGSVEKKDQNKQIIALYKFFLNHQNEFDQLYLEAGTPKELAELMLSKTEDILRRKSRTILKDYLAYLGIKRDLPEDLTTFELSESEMDSLDRAKLNADFINSHPEFQELKPLVGEMSDQEVADFVTSGYFTKVVSFEQYKLALPSLPELVGTVAGQLYVPKTALGIVSQAAAGLYSTPVIAADIGTGISMAICLQKETQDKFESDQDLKSFCSYVTNKTSYELMKSRAKGYIAGKTFHEKISEKIRLYRERREEKKRQKEQLH